jgi:aminopeptidase N
MPLRILTVCLLIFLSEHCRLQAAAPEPESTSTAQPTVPLHYLIHLEPNLEAERFEGAEDIQLQVRSPIRDVTLDAVDLEIVRAVLYTSSGKLVLRPEGDDVAQQLRLVAQQEIPPGEYHLGLRFRGKIHREPHGLCLVPPTGAPAAPSILASRLAPCSAREVFPCFDQPGSRVRIQLSIRTARKNQVISNLPTIAEQPIGTDKVVIFAETPPMPVYLMSLVCGELAALQEQLPTTNIRILTLPGSEPLAQYALGLTKQLLQYYEDYFGAPFPLPKLDQVALPSPWSGTAVGWGTVTYPSDTVLIRPGQATVAQETVVFEQIARAIAQQWLGALVGFDSWDDLWLGKGLASWMQAKATEHLHPEWKFWLAQTPRLDDLMLNDAGDRSQPIQRPIHSPQEAFQAYEGYAPLKTERLLRMIEAFVGQSAFHDGVKSFLVSYALRTAQSQDFWSSIDSKSSREVAVWAARWFTQPGLPLVKITSQCVNDRRIVSLEQMRLTLRQEATAGEPEQWTIPVGILNVVPAERTRYALLQKVTENFETGTCQAAIKANPGALGYFRVWYEPALVGQLEKHTDLLDESDRVNLVSDVFATVQTQRTPVSVFMDLVDRWRDDRSLNVWRAIRHALVALDQIEAGENGRERFQSCVCTLLGDRFGRLGWEPVAGEPAERSQERAEVIETLGRFGDRAIIDDAFRRFEALQTDPAAVPPSLNGAVLRLVGRYSSEGTFKALQELAQKESSPADKQLCLEALGDALDPGLVNLFLEQQASLPNMNLASFTMILANVAEAGEHADLVWHFLKNRPDLRENAELWRNGDLVSALAFGLSTPQFRQEFLSAAQSFAGVIPSSRLSDALMLHDLKTDSQATIEPALDAWVNKRLSGKEPEPSPDSHGGS